MNFMQSCMVLKCVMHGKRGACYSFSESHNNAIECVVHGCDVLNKRGFARPCVLSEHTLVRARVDKETHLPL